MPLLDATGLIQGESVEALPNTTTVAELLDSGRNQIAIAFPAFTDGRGFSLARALRQAGYGGRLRAVGELIPDQFAFALDCGFDEIEISAERLARQPVEQWLAARDAITVAYQPNTRVTDIFAARKAARA
jgi:uncharacterized protein (DUF934 family)